MSIDPVVKIKKVIFIKIQSGWGFVKTSRVRFWVLMLRAICCSGPVHCCPSAGASRDCLTASLHPCPQLSSRFGSCMAPVSHTYNRIDIRTFMIFEMGPELYSPIFHRINVGPLPAGST